MKRLLVLIVILLVSVSCSKKNEILCIKKDVSFSNGIMDRYITFYYDNQNYITSSKIVENRLYNTEADAFSFLDHYSENTEKVSEKELKYIEVTEYEEKVTIDEIKSAMEYQDYICK